MVPQMILTKGMHLQKCLSTKELNYAAGKGCSVKSCTPALINVLLIANGSITRQAITARTLTTRLGFKKIEKIYTRKRNDNGDQK